MTGSGRSSSNTKTILINNYFLVGLLIRPGSKLNESSCVKTAHRVRACLDAQTLNCRKKSAPSDLLLLLAYCEFFDNRLSFFKKLVSKLLMVVVAYK